MSNHSKVIWFSVKVIIAIVLIELGVKFLESTRDNNGDLLHGLFEVIPYIVLILVIVIVVFRKREEGGTTGTSNTLNKITIVDGAKDQTREAHHFIKKPLAHYESTNDTVKKTYDLEAEKKSRVHTFTEQGYAEADDRNPVSPSSKPMAAESPKICSICFEEGAEFEHPEHGPICAECKELV